MRPELLNEPLSVSEAIGLFNTIFAELPLIVEGEVANYGVSQGKFVFFDIKDEEQEARLPCFMMLFKQTVPLEDGMRVRLTCKPNIHQKTGKFSLTVERIEAKGEGSLRRAFELLQKKLQEEGLFSPERKRLLPQFPRRVGVISSRDAAGYGDFMRIAGQRLPGVHFVLAHCAVQGELAERDITFAFDHLNSHFELDCIVLIRGGGSMEDLHAFNSEPVARAIVRSKVPVLVGVGHEKDITIADFCADVRAATPSNAAQLLLVTKEEVVGLLVERTEQGGRLIARSIERYRERVIGGVERLHQLITWSIERYSAQVTQGLERMRQQLLSQLRGTQQRVMQMQRTIEAISPQATLARGYSITRTKSGELVRKPADAPPGTTLITHLASDSLTSVVQ